MCVELEKFFEGKFELDAFQDVSQLIYSRNLKLQFSCNNNSSEKTLVIAASATKRHRSAHEGKLLSFFYVRQSTIKNFNYSPRSLLFFRGARS